MLEVKGIRYVRHARVIEFGLKDIKGILSVSVSATGWINIEFDQHEITPSCAYALFATKPFSVTLLRIRSIKLIAHP